MCLDILSHYLLILLFYSPISSLVLVSSERTYQTLKTVFHHISKYTSLLVVHCILNSSLDAGKCCQIRSFVFDILLQKIRAALKGLWPLSTWIRILALLEPGYS